jgi:DNA-binding CsgD family transcriptional regulator
MALRLSNQDFDACSRGLRELYAEVSTAQFPNQVLKLLAGLVPVEHATYNELTPRQKQLVVHYFPERPDIQALVPQFAATLHTHPLYDHYVGAEPLPKKISDATSFRQLAETPVYQEYYRLIGIKHQMVFSVKGAGETKIGLALNRRLRDFSERDRSVLSFLSPHITQAFHNARITSEMAVNLERVGEGLGEINRAVILVEADGRIRWLSHLAREWLAELFPGDYTPASDLPGILKGRLIEFAKAGTAASRLFCQFQFAGALGHRLVAYCGRAGKSMFIIAMTRERPSIEAGDANSLGLTPRESEILFWISEAKANPEIASILGISPRTVHKHVEHLFAKLGINSRFEAQRLGWELRRL